MTHKNILILAHDGEDFYKARMPFARFLKDHGFHVFVSLPHDKYTDLIAREGITVLHSSLERDNTSPFNLIRTVFRVRAFAKANHIDLVHSFKFVPNLINSFSNLFTKRKVVLHIAGLGIAFANKSTRYRFLKLVSQILFFFQFLRANLVIIQNPDDYDDFLFKENFRQKIKLVKGSGVNTTLFSPIAATESATHSDRKIIFLCTTRLIWEKGIREMVDAFEGLPSELKSRVQLHIIGEPDDKNPRSVTQEYIANYTSSTLIHFMGRQDGIPEHLRRSDIFILPSYYREGIPRSILEALATGLPVITTTVPGCNLTVKNEINGFLIEPRSTDAIRVAVEKMIALREKWPEMGRASRSLALAEFSEEQVFSEIITLYNQ